MALRIEEARRTGRVPRKPRHTFQIRSRPFEITPFMIAPVLPGETLKNLLLQSRAVTDPIKSPLIGWWKEYYFFYVKHRDLAARDTFAAMMLEPTTNLNTVDTAATNTWLYSAVTDDPNNLMIDWVNLCMQTVVNEWFRDEGDIWSDFVGDALHPVAKIVGETWLQSAVDSSTIVDPEDLTIDQTPTADISIADVQTKLQQYEFLRNNALTNMTYEDFLETYGVSSPTVELHRPELIRYIRDWTYPSNTIDPADGSPTSAASWKIAERADKDRFFKEPGFICGYTVTRPKIYLGRQAGNASALLNDAYMWLPALLGNDPRTSQKNVTLAKGPLNLTTGDYTVDMRDLFLYGDQFVNFALSELDAALLNLPDLALDQAGIYPTGTLADELFVGADPANQIREDGVVSLTILGTQVDMTP